MDLSSEDSLRLNVLLRQGLQAVRIDESRIITISCASLALIPHNSIIMATSLPFCASDIACA